MVVFCDLFLSPFFESRIFSLLFPSLLVVVIFVLYFRIFVEFFRFSGLFMYHFL